MAGENLRIVTGAGAGRSISLDADFIVGRDEPGMGNLQGDTKISRRHALFRRTPNGQLTVEDLGSTNGTYVNGQRITGPHTLAPGDQVKVGDTVLSFEAPAQAEVQPAPVAPANVAAPVGAAAAAQPGPKRPGGIQPGGYSGRRRAFGALVVLLLVGGALAAGIAIGNSGDDGGTATAGGSGPTADAAAVGTVYIESNKSGSDANSILAYQYGDGGDMHPLRVTEYPTGGSGSTDLTDSGVLDADQHVVYSPEKKLLFAVNQGSDSVAVFHVAGDGGLTPVKGSPFPSGGKAPASVGLSGNTLVVVNKAQDGIRKLDKVAPNYTTFSVAGDGSLKPIGSTINAPAGNSPTQALISTDGKVVMSSEEGGPFRAFSLSGDGKLTQGPNSPLSPPESIYPPKFDPKLKWALGLGVHPTQNIMYAQMATVSKMAVYRYDAQGKLTFVRAAPNPGAELPCWTVVNKDGTRVYTDNAGNNTMSVYDTSDPLNPKQIQLLKLTHDGNPWDVHLDPTGKFLFMIDPRARTNVKPGQGQEIHLVMIGPDGKLTEPAGSTASIPVPGTAQPIGLTVAARY